MPIGCVPGYVPSYVSRSNSSGSSVDNDKGAFSRYRRRENTYKDFNVNTFVQHVVENMKTKHQEYEKARVKFVTRFEEKCDFIDKVVFPAVKACSTNPTQNNMRAMVNAFKEGVEKFTTFGRMSGLAQIFEAAYFAMTDAGSFNVTAKSAVFDMDDSTRNVVYGPQSKAGKTTTVVGVPVTDRSTNRAAFFSAADAVVGVPVVNHQPQHRETPDHSFFSMMCSVQVPQHPVRANQHHTEEETGVDCREQCCSA